MNQLFRFCFLFGFGAFLSHAAVVAETLYEEDPVDSMAWRERQWQSMDRYVASLEAGGVDNRANLQAAAQAVASSAGAERLRAQFKQSIGYPPPNLVPPAEARLEHAGEDELAVYYRCTLPFAEGFDVYGLYLVPKNLQQPAPLVIAQHGGGGYPELALFKGGSNYRDLVRGPLRKGWIVFAPHFIFYPYRDRDHGTPVPQDVRATLDRRLRERGTSLAAVEVAQIARALDVLLKRPEVDPGRVAMAGLSYGGYYTLYTTALDERIRTAVASCSFVDWGRTLDAQPAHPAEYQPGGRLNDLSPVDLARLIAPRPLQIQVGKRDKVFSYDQSAALAKRAMTVYGELGCEDALEYEAFDGGHEFRGELAWPFLSRYLK